MDWKDETDLQIQSDLNEKQEDLPICNVCGESIEDDEEFGECDCCELPYHFDDCGGKGSFVGIETYGCDNCRKYD